MQTEVCVVWNGVHAYVAPHCPHGRTEDELGPIKPPGWTAQQATPDAKEQHHGR